MKFSILLTVENSLRGDSLSFVSIFLKNKKNIFEGQTDEGGVCLIENIFEGDYELILKKDKENIFKEFITINNDLIYEVYI